MFYIFAFLQNSRKKLSCISSNGNVMGCSYDALLVLLHYCNILKPTSSPCRVHDAGAVNGAGCSSSANKIRRCPHLFSEPSPDVPH